VKAAKASVDKIRAAGRAALAAAAFSLLLAGCGAASRENYEAGTAALGEGDYSAAVDSFSKAAEAGEFTAESYRGEGIAYLSMASYADACIAFEKSLLNADGETEEFVKDVNLYLAKARTLHGQIDKALEIYDALLMKEADADIYFQRGCINLDKGLDDAAESDFENAVANTDDFMYYVDIYAAYAELDKQADGSRYLQMALDKAGDAEENSYARGMVQYCLQNYTEARKELLAALSYDAGDADALLLLGRVYLAMGDTPNARATYRTHLENPESALAAYTGLVLCDLTEGNGEEAVKDLEEAFKLEGASEDRDLRYYEILAYETMSDWESARAKSAAFITDFPMDEAGLRENTFLASR